ncbi:MAG: CCC motif membrane protein [Bacteroidales bacterium]|jgi:hypothetical protein|nr:CCC motif membrane protein [Bacteroidales bacterium]MDD3200501.1 CCC motif membrane protein [Bacteroidales bacterium]
MEILDNRKRPLPNASAVFVLGVLSLVFTGFSGLVMGIIGASLASRSWKSYNEDPDAYYGYGQLNAGRIMSIIGIIKNVLVVIVLIVVWIFFGATLVGLITGDAAGLCF